MSELIERAKYAIEYGNSDDLHRELVAEVERLSRDNTMLNRQLDALMDTDRGELITRNLELANEIEALRQTHALELQDLRMQLANAWEGKR